MKPLFVIGNGPSLRGFDLHRLSGFDTLGMNAAYRHWDRISWYPKYYCCLDEELVKTHHNEIRRLVVKGQVQSAFVTGNFFELHPDLVADARFLSFDQVNGYWYRIRGKSQGLPFVSHVAFKSGIPDKVTTGSYAVRYGAYLGYDLLALLGIDLKYIEIIAEAKQGDGIGLEIERTPARNPNYFFDDYQQAGDKYNLPNPVEHGGELHPASFTVLRDDFQRNNLPVRIVNCNAASILDERAIFPFADVESLLGEAKLAAVVIPCNKWEIDQIIASLKIWSLPAFAPYLGPLPASRPKLVFVFNNEEAREDSEKILQAMEKYGTSRFFSGTELRFLDLTGAADAYIRDYEIPAGDTGYKAGPNNQFFLTLDLMKAYGQYCLMIEADCVPIRPDWLRILCNKVDAAEPFWIMGSLYRGKNTIGKRISRHINGSAIYATGNSAFQKFIEDIWRPRLTHIVLSEDRRIAYDCSLEFDFHSMRSDVEDDPTWLLWQATAHLLRYSAFIMNMSGTKDLDGPAPDLVRQVLRASPETLFLHNQAVASSMAAALEDKTLVDAASLVVSPRKVPPEARRRSTKKKQAAPAQAFVHFLYTYPSPSVQRNGELFLIPPGNAQNFVTCQYTGKIRSGSSIRADVELGLPEACRLTVSFCRDGNTPWEANVQTLDLPAGEHKITLEKKFKYAHSGARIQIESVDRLSAVRILRTNLTPISTDPQPAN
ncbi:hypothetical protein BH10PSE7_BH10PSE7_25810 [soil metagenome]